MPARSVSGCPYGVCPIYWCPLAGSRRHHPHVIVIIRLFIATHVVILLCSVVVVVIFGRHRQHASGPDAIVGRSLVSALSLFHVCLVQAASARGRVLLTPGRWWQRGLEYGLANVSGLLWASLLKARLDHLGCEVVFLIVAGDWNFSAYTKAAFHGLEQLSDDSTVGWDLHLHSSVALEVDHRE